VRIVTAEAQREKTWAAATSVVAAVGLTAFKIVVGLATGSLGIVAEAAHSALDLAAAVMTFFAIRISGRPADTRHLYGHGKVENLSALAETGLLALTCVWIIWRAADRLVEHSVEIEVTFWSFAVMVTSILIDWSRSRVLYRAARKHKSDALEADALHFSTDIWSSLVVIVGLVCVKLSEWQPSLGVLRYADAVAAITVALIVVQVSVKLGWRTTQTLLDAAPAGLDGRVIAAVEALPGVTDCHNVRVRYSGSVPFVDVHVLLDGDVTLRAAHEITEQIEGAIQEVLPGADVTVHPEPRA
jgi:cation diffusion facilitator family transporter